MANTQVFRVETYQLAAGDFSGGSYKLRLRHQLSTNYFVMLQWGPNVTANVSTSEVGVNVTEDPYGTGDLALSGGNWLTLKRATSAECNADIEVVVVECLTDSTGAGFTLVDVAITSLAAGGGIGLQTTVDTCAAWGNLAQVTPFGGYKGGGIATNALAANTKIQSLAVSIVPSLTNTLTFVRHGIAAINLVASKITTYVVEWGTEWTVQRATVAGTNTGATLDNVAHYSTQALGMAVPRASSWLWQCGYTNQINAGNMGIAQVATLGDGVTQLATEATVACGCCQALTTRSVVCYVMSHAKLATDWVFKTAAMGVGSKSLTVDAATGTETYSGTDAYYTATTNGRLPYIQASAPSGLMADLAETMIMARHTASTTVTATNPDTAPALAWVGWLESVDFSGVVMTQDSLPSFRVTTYRITGATFAGATLDLALNNPLVPNYFVMLLGTDTSTPTPLPVQGNAWVSQDPWGTGDLAVSSGPKVLRIARGGSTNPWEGEVVVVECLRGSAHQGFRLVDVKSIALGAFADTGVQVVNATANAAWSAVERVVVFAGHRGGGLQPTVPHLTQDIQSQGVAVLPTGLNGLQAMRYTNSNTACKALTAWCYIVEFGDKWQVQQLLVQATAGGAGVNLTTEYATFFLTEAVDPTKTLVWGSFAAEESPTSSCWLSPAMCLGDGVAQLASETRLSIGLETASAYLGAVYVLSHASLRNEWHFIASTASVALAQAIASPVRSESYPSSTTTCGQRGCLIYSASSSAADPPQAAGAMVFPMPTSFYGAETLYREDNSGNWAGWTQAFDFGGIYTVTGAIEVGPDDALLGPVQQYLILQDPQWDGNTNVVRATSEGGLTAGPVDAATGNQGSVVGSQEGTPVADSELSYRLRGGAVGGSGGWLWRYLSETTAADWKAMNAPTQLWRQQSCDIATRWAAHDIAYSTAFRRILIAETQSPTDIRVYYKDVDDFTLATWAHYTVVVSDAVNPSTSRNGLGMCEIPDGSMLMVYSQYAAITGGLGIINLAALTSTDGGATWSRIGNKILSKTRIGSIYTSANFGGQHQLESSGDWVRCAFIAGDDGTVTQANMETIVSPDRGSSWKALVDVKVVDGWLPAGGPMISCPFAMVGCGDASGTFILAQLPHDAPANIRFSIAARDDDWVEYPTLDWDVSGYATQAACKALCFVRDPDRIWLFAWIEGTDASELVVATVDPTDPTNPDSWKVLGYLTGCGDPGPAIGTSVMRYGPHALRGVWAGHRMLLSAGLYDSTVAAAADPLVVGHWMLQSGGYDPKPWDYSLLDYIANDVFVSQPKVCSLQWQPCMGDPAGGGAASSALTPWARTTVGGTVFTWLKDEVTIVAGAAADVGYYSFATPVIPAAPEDYWASTTYSFGRNTVFSLICQVTVSRIDPLVGEDCGIRITPVTTGVPSGYDFSVRIGALHVAIFDNVGVGAIISSVATTDFVVPCELRIILAGNTVGLRWRKIASGPLAAWTELAPAVIAPWVIANQDIRIGILAATGPAGTSSFRWRGLAISRRSDLGQMTDIVKPTDLMGTRLNRGAMLVANGVRVKWGGSGATDLDAFTGTLDHIRGTQNLSMDSPRYYWESTTMVSQELVFRTATLALSRWQMNALLMVGTVDRTATLQFSNVDSTAAWAAPAAEFTLSADLYTDLDVIAVDGSALQVQAATGDTFSPRRGGLIGAYLRFTVAGIATGITIKLKNQVATGNWLHAEDDVDLSTLGVTIGAKACIFADRLVFMSKLFQQYHFFRLVFPDVSAVPSSKGTYTGTHRIGSMVPGFWQKLSVPMDWSCTDNEQPNVTEYRSKGGAGWQYEEGPAQRIFKGIVIGDCEEQRRTLRDALREFHGYSVRPIGLVLDSTNPSRDTVVFGRWDAGGQMDDAAWYRDSAGVWRQAGDADLTVIEEV